MMPNINDIIDWENGNMDFEREVTFFAGLVKSGMAGTLQGCYGRRAADMIAGGYITRRGDVVGVMFDGERFEQN